MKYQTAASLAWLLALVAVAVGGQALLTGPLQAPALLDPGSWPTWASARTAVEAAVAVLGAAVVAAAWYLLGATTLQVAARVVGNVRLLRVADLVTLPVIRRSVQVTLGVGLAGSVALTGSPALAASSGSPAAASAPEETGDPPVMRRLPDALTAPVAAPPVPAVTPDEWVVAPGEHLWSVASRVLESAWASQPGDSAVAPYWRELVAANADRLADPANPDLVYPGQRLAVVEPPPPPR